MPLDLYVMSVLNEMPEDNPFIARLARGGIIVNFDEREALEAKRRLDCSTPQGGTVAVTICPTMACNFECPYCFASLGRGKMKPEVQESSYLLYGILVLALVGVVGAGIVGEASNLQIPAFTGFTASAQAFDASTGAAIVDESGRAVINKAAQGGFLFPALFITIACGALSGIHSMVASGTTSKQLDRESQALPIDFGSMLIECMLAILALLAVCVWLGNAGRNNKMLYIPMVFISAATIASLVLTIHQKALAISAGGAILVPAIQLVLAIALLVLAIVLIAKGAKTLYERRA